MNSTSTNVEMTFTGSPEDADSLGQLLATLTDNSDEDFSVGKRTIVSPTKSTTEIITAVTLAVSSIHLLAPHIIRAIAIWLDRPGSREITIVKEKKGKRIETVISGRNIRSTDFSKTIANLQRELDR